jgi:acetyl esterase/lipase
VVYQLGTHSLVSQVMSLLLWILCWLATDVHIWLGGMVDRLDLYLPEKIDEPKPVVIFVPGGAWLIG